MAFIEMKQVSKSFGSVQALNRLDLDIEEEEKSHESL